MPDAIVTVADRLVGAGQPCLVIAELGVNHDGRAETALRLVDAAADAGADVIKLQTFEPDLLVTTEAPLAEYQRAQTGGRHQHAMLRDLQLDHEGHLAVQARAADRGVVFLSTPFDATSADDLVAMGVPAIKIGSGEVTNLPFLRVLAGHGLPVILSTGMSTLDEVDAAVEAVRDGGDPPLVLLHCVSSYPSQPRDANLRAMATMRDRYGVPVGFSDHTPGIEVAIAAAAVGAAVLEKHLTLDRRASGPDHQASLEPDDFAAMVRGIRTAEEALGDGIKAPVEAERDVAAAARRSVAAGRDLAAGDVIALDDLTLLRPGTGLPPSAMDDLVGRTLRSPVSAGTLLHREDLA